VEAGRGHREVGECAASLGINRLIALGPGAAGMASSAEAAGLTQSSVVASAAEAADLLCENAHPGDLVLVKGSRSARTELVLEEFAKRQMEIRCAS
jgi:UDP-N-acetylmuramoyl-tripeptide--D-alanyl-D-alanine ligase